MIFRQGHRVTDSLTVWTVTDCDHS